MKLSLNLYSDVAIHRNSELSIRTSGTESTREWSTRIEGEVWWLVNGWVPLTRTVLRLLRILVELMEWPGLNSGNMGLAGSLQPV